MICCMFKKYAGRKVDTGEPIGLDGSSQYLEQVVVRNEDHQGKSTKNTLTPRFIAGDQNYADQSNFASSFASRARLACLASKYRRAW